MILILTGPEDLHADHLQLELERRGAQFFRYDPRSFPSTTQISVTLSSDGPRRVYLATDAREIDLGSVTSAWYRRPNSPEAGPQVPDAITREAIGRESRGFLSDVWNALDCLWIPAPEAVLRRGHKITHLSLARHLGLQIPATLITNSPQALLDFYREHDGQIISKRVGFPFPSAIRETFARYTEMVSPRDIGYAHGVRYCPVMFQEYVQKRVELRVTIVGDRLFAAEIHSQRSSRTSVDWRHFDDFGTPYDPHELPPEIAGRLLELTRRLGLSFAAIDMVVTPDGRYVFLEINPNGQYLWVELATGLPITNALCDLLISGLPGDTPHSRYLAQDAS